MSLLSISDVADEDIQIIIAVARNLAQKAPQFQLNLPNNVTLTNISDAKFMMPGIDFIGETHKKIMDIDAQNEHILVMPSSQFNSRVKIGNMFGMDMYADPACPKDKFLIEPVKEAQQ